MIAMIMCRKELGRNYIIGSDVKGIVVTHVALVEDM